MGIKYRELSFINNFFFALVFFTIFSLWVICSEFGVYCIKHRGKKVQGKVEYIEKTNNNRLKIEYSYQVGTQNYTGHRFYRSTIRYKHKEIVELINQIKKKRIYPVYYKQKHPEDAVCFVTHEKLRLNKALFIGLLGGWVFWGLGYLQAWIWDKNRR